EEQFLLISQERARRQRSRSGLAHTLKHIVVRNDLRAFSRVLNVAGNVTTCNSTSGFSNRLVSSSVVRIVRGIHYVADRPFRKSANSGNNLARQRRVFGIDDEHPVISNLHGN